MEYYIPYKQFHSETNLYMMTAKEIRQQYLDFFKSKGHNIVPSAPMVIKNDPTLMFTNAGMNQFKDIFLGNQKAQMSRATDSQKCLRVSGKHNDLEAVGHDGYHHTMFEMLGNWSFGDYFKTEAIDWAWELLTEVYKIDPSILYATVFEGDSTDGTSLDEEARIAWRKYLPEDHILLGNKHDNFWEMGDTGPCGPCSEIHVDLRSAEEKSKISGASLVNKDNPLVIEIWNLVFMQFNRKADGHLENLPHKNIDTGMGFERLCMVLQHKTSNYDTDVFTAMISRIEELSGHKYNNSEKEGVAMRVIADHIRAIAFSIADGQLPSNVKAGYVIRRILRRAVRYGYTFLDFSEAFLYKLIDQLVEDMGVAYPELVSQKEHISLVIQQEEQAFLRTLDRGIKMLDEYMTSSSTKTIDGEVAFTLYDTYGFPIDLTELIAEEKGYNVDLVGFEKHMNMQKERARSAGSNEFGDWVEYHNGKDVEFVGYDYLEVKNAILLKHRTVKQKNKTFYQLVFDKTPFYAEMGGQAGDIGYIEDAKGEKIRILNTIKENDLSIHLAERIPNNATEPFNLFVDKKNRLNTANNHSATHLVDHVLREVLGTGVEQKGSFVSADYFRFDFSHFSKLSTAEIQEIENRVNDLIRSNYALEENRQATMEEAMELGAIALFGEKYGDKVRWVKFGPSIELCGGTHVARTGQIGLFKIVSESAVAAGVRRIECLTGQKAEEYVNSLIHTLHEAKALFNNSPDLLSAINKLQQENSEYKKELESLMAEKAKLLAQELVAKAESFGDKRLIKIREAIEPNLLKQISSNLQKSEKALILLAAFAYEQKPQLLIMYSQDLVEKGKNAGKDIREAAKLIQGGGGGQSGLANAGGKNTDGLESAFEKMLELAQ